MESTGTEIIEPYSVEWFKQRQGCFTGSEVYKLMTEPRSKSENWSKTAETYILDKVWEKLSGQVKSGIDNMATQWGVEHEPKAKIWYTKLSGNEIQEANLIRTSLIKNFSGTPDGFVGDQGMIEIKCPFNGSNHLKHCFITKDDYFKKEFTEYYWQIQSYLHVTGRKWCDFVSFDPRINSDLGMFIYRVAYNVTDGLLLEEKIEKANEFFDEYYRLFSQTNAEESKA